MRCKNNTHCKVGHCCRMFLLWLSLIITSASSHDTESVTPLPNITTLYPTNKTIVRNDSDSRPSRHPQTWKLEASFAESNLTEIEVEAKNTSDSREEKDKKEENGFKPSPHLGSFFDEDSAEVIKTPMAGPIVKTPASGFVSSIKNEYHDFAKIPKEIYQTHKQFPYQYEDAIYTKAKLSWIEEPMDSKPTVEVPHKIPAGGFYQSPGAFKDKPNSDEEFGLDINEEVKEHGLKKRGNPWQSLLRLVTAFIPVGLIISALTPSVITIQNVDDNRAPSNMFRRSDAGPGITNMAPISERCRRRLLCELHSDNNYEPPSSKPRGATKQCYKLRCEDTDALWRMLRWLFTYKQPHDQRARRGT